MWTTESSSRHWKTRYKSYHERIISEVPQKLLELTVDLVLELHQSIIAELSPKCLIINLIHGYHISEKERKFSDPSPSLLENEVKSTKEKYITVPKRWEICRGKNLGIDPRKWIRNRRCHLKTIMKLVDIRKLTYVERTKLRRNEDGALLQWWTTARSGASGG